MREALGHHLETCFKALFPQEGMRQGGPNPQEFIARNTQELQESRILPCSRRLPAIAPHPGEDGELRVCIDVPGLNQAASQERLWPLRVGRFEGPPHNYVRMPFGFPSVASAYQRDLQCVLAAQEARYHAVLEEMETVFREPAEPLEPPEAQGPGGS